MNEEHQQSNDLDYGLLHGLLGHLLRHAFNRGQSQFAEVFAADDITPLQFMIAELIANNPQVTHSSICLAMQTAPSVVTTTIKPMIANEWITRSASVSDKRMIRYALSAKGEDWFGQLRPKINRCEDQLTKMLTEKQRRELVHSLQLLCGLNPD